MRSVIALMIGMLVVCNVNAKALYKNSSEKNISIETVCIEGYLFVLAQAKTNIDIEQVYRPAGWRNKGDLWKNDSNTSNPPQPVMCGLRSSN